jgi:p-cumate 2,3-dioxygenase beta subunit
MCINRLIVQGAFAVALCVVNGVASPGTDCPRPARTVGYYERCVRAVAPALAVRHEQPVVGDSPLRRLSKLRFASALQRLKHTAERVADYVDTPDKLLLILKDLGQSQFELCDDTSALIPVLEARVELSRLIEELKEREVEVGRSAAHNLEDARYARLDAEVQLARARAALVVPRRDRATMIRQRELQHCSDSGGSSMIPNGLTSSVINRASLGDGYIRVRDGGLVAAVAQFLYDEAALLDEWRLDDWLALFHPDRAEYVVPSPEDLSDNPAKTLHLVHDSMAILSGRITRLKSKHAHAESPRSRTRRQITNVRVWRGPDDLQSRSVFNVMRVRGGMVDRFTGVYEHQLLPVDDEDTPWLIGRRRVLIDHDVEAGGGSLSFLL